MLGKLWVEAWEAVRLSRIRIQIAVDFQTHFLIYCIFLFQGKYNMGNFGNDAGGSEIKGTGAGDATINSPVDVFPTHTIPTDTCPYVTWIQLSTFINFYFTLR